VTPTASPSVALSSGASMPLVGFGTWQLHGKAAYRAVRTALDVGYRLIDTATMYRNEKQVGQAIADSGIARGELFVTTKLPPGNAGREERTIQASLGALGLDHVDLWLIHWPPAARALVPTWEAVRAARDAGFAASVGVSNYDIDQIDRLIDATDEAPTVNQVPWAPSLFDPEFLGASRDRTVVVEGYSPFKNTNLRDRELAAIAENHGVSPAQVVVRWHVQHEVVVIPKSASPDRIAENFDVFDFELSREEMGTLDGFGH
jgi:2,5-diketo-D-gluconate reductase A